MTVGLILAGGAATRLGGQNKAELTVGGRRLIDRVASRLARCERLLVAVGPAGAALPVLPDTAVPIFDLTSERIGPLGGLAAAVAQLTGLAPSPRFVLSVAVDTPFLPPDYGDRMHAAIGDADAVIATVAGQPYPTNALWRLSALADLPERLRTGTAPRSLRALGDELRARPCEWPLDHRGDPFANVNTSADHQRLDQMAPEYPAE